MAPGSLKECHIVVLKGTGFREDYTTQNLKKWIENAGGHVAFKEFLSEQTTHVVMDEDTWIEQGPFVQQILKAEVKDTSERKGRSIHIVSFDWLQECLDKRIKRGESAFKWKNLAGGVLKDAQRSAKQQAREDKQPGNTQGLMAQAFLDSTDKFVDAGEKRRIEKRKRQEAADRAEELEEEKRQFELHRKKMSVPEQAAVFRKGAKKARNDILSDNHHIYVDNTGFTYDVTITKVDFNHNANERYVLTIYETNTEPHSYAFNCSFGGTQVLPVNDIIAAIGSNFPTAFRAFKKVFKEKTKVAWDDRILAYEQRVANASMGIDQDKPFDQMPFQYDPPKYGPLGELPLAQNVAMAEKEKEPGQPPVVGKMSGNTGLRNTSKGLNEFMTTAAKETGYLPDDPLNKSALSYPFDVAGGAEDDAIVLDDDDDMKKNVTSMAADPKNSVVRGESSAKEPTETYHFDDALGLTQPLELPHNAGGMSENVSPSSSTVGTQHLHRTQLAESIRAGLVADSAGATTEGDGEDKNEAAANDGETEAEEFI